MNKLFKIREIALASAILTWVCLVPFSAVASLSIESALEIGRSLKHPTPQSFLSSLPEAYRGQFLLAPKTFSSHEATPLRPRIILYNENIIMAFNGIETSDSFNMVEVQDISKPQPDFYLLDFSGQKVKIKDNPTSCHDCHSQYQKPIWPTVNLQPFWPNFFGAGAFGVSGDQEVRVLEQFKAESSQHPLYSQLPSVSELQAYGPNGMMQVNGDFENLISTTVSKQVANYLAHQKNFMQFAPALLAVLAYSKFEPENESEFIKYLKLVSSLLPPGAQPITLDWLKQDSAKVRKKLRAESSKKWKIYFESFDEADGDDLEVGSHWINDYSVLVSMLKVTAKAYGIKDLLDRMSTNIKSGVHEQPGKFGPWGLAGKLEDLVFSEVIKVEPKAKHLKRTQEEVDLHDIGLYRFGSWQNLEVMSTGLTQLNNWLSGEVENCVSTVLQKDQPTKGK